MKVMKVVKVEVDEAGVEVVVVVVINSSSKKTFIFMVQKGTSQSEVSPG